MVKKPFQEIGQGLIGEVPELAWANVGKERADTLPHLEGEGDPQDLDQEDGDNTDPLDQEDNLEEEATGDNLKEGNLAGYSLEEADNQTTEPGSESDSDTPGNRSGEVCIPEERTSGLIQP